MTCLARESSRDWRSSTRISWTSVSKTTGLGVVDSGAVVITPDPDLDSVPPPDMCDTTDGDLVIPVLPPFTDPMAPVSPVLARPPGLEAVDGDRFMLPVEGDLV